MKSSTPLFQGIINTAAQTKQIMGVMKGLGLSGNSNSLPVDNTHMHSSSNNTSSLGAPEEGDTIRGSRQGTGNSVPGANRITPRPEDGRILPASDNVAGSLSGNAKAQSLGENLWEGEAFAEQRALKRQVGASPVPTPGSEFDEYGGMFAQPLAQSGKIKDPTEGYEIPTEGVQDLEDKGAIKVDKKGPYVVNKAPYGHRKSDTLRLPSNFSQQKNKLIDQTDYRTQADPKHKKYLQSVKNLKNI